MIAVWGGIIKVVFVLPKQDEGLDWSLTSGNEVHVVSPPLDAEASSQPLCRKPCRGVSEVLGGGF